MAAAGSRIRLDLNSPEFQDVFFRLQADEIKQIVASLRRLRELDWNSLYRHTGTNTTRTRRHEETLKNTLFGQFFPVGLLQTCVRRPPLAHTTVAPAGNPASLRRSRRHTNGHPVRTWLPRCRRPRFHIPFASLTGLLPGTLLFLGIELAQFEHSFRGAAGGYCSRHTTLALFRNPTSHRGRVHTSGPSCTWPPRCRWTRLAHTTVASCW